MKTRKLKRRGPKPTPPRDRFEEYVERAAVPDGDNTTPCHRWTGAYDRSGFPIFGLAPGVAVKAHRWIYERKVGRRLKKMRRVKHTCGNKACVNPQHIELE